MIDLSVWEGELDLGPLRGRRPGLWGAGGTGGHHGQWRKEAKGFLARQDDSFDQG